MSSKVYFANRRADGHRDNTANKLGRLFDAADIKSVLSKDDLTAVKLHFGEPGCDTFLRPIYARAIIDKIKACGAKPFLTDSNTLYSGARYNTVDHLRAAILHGFDYAAMGAPTLIADGLFGENVVEVAIGQKHFASAKIAGAIAKASSMVVLSHFKGHGLAGFGGAIKNMAMGCAPAAGKRDQHSPRFFVKGDACVGCGECESICPVGAATVTDGTAAIDKSLCIGCGECHAHCAVKAVSVDWATDIPIFMERMTEYALGAVLAVKRRVGYVNFVMDVTPDCDCVSWSDAPLVPDIGIVAGLDPVAVDAACMDLVNKQIGLAGTRLTRNLASGEDKFTGLASHTKAEIQLNYGEAIGLGTREYELIEV